LKEPPTFLKQLADEIDSFSVENRQMILDILDTRSFGRSESGRPIDTAFDVAIRFDRKGSLALLCKILNKIFNSAADEATKEKCRQLQSEIFWRAADWTFQQIIDRETRDITNVHPAADPSA
jgi:hypothetical protein